MQKTVYIAIGTNIGDREQNITEALRRINSSEGLEVVKNSSLHETEPLGPPQPGFLNAAAELKCGVGPEELLKVLKDIEKGMGRQDGERWGPRIIDLDILLFGERVIESEKLTIPHPEMAGRAFVLEPLAEIAAGEVHPVSGKTVAELLRELVETEIKREDV